MKDIRVAELQAMLKEILATSGADISLVNAVTTIQMNYMLQLNAFSSLGELGTLVRALEQSRINPDLEQGVALPLADSVQVNEADWLAFEQLYSQRVIAPLFS